MKIISCGAHRFRLAAFLPVGAVLARDKGDAVSLQDRSALIAGKHRSHRDRVSSATSTKKPRTMAGLFDCGLAAISYL
ncbi:hypothetical protein AUC61_07485 [Pseudomonas sp. S25]|uniref:Uncharacterized protein n=1 Tax=Pseudomonas maioricensis TaxID=1766623 RepID=A0ABS9ZFK2_9PSED|nr:hypothetical protein [Pseudomonas sp. S25]